jgi:protein-S-isoprenylcysteine O-methyltransferase Ste14
LKNLSYVQQEKRIFLFSIALVIISIVIITKAYVDLGKEYSPFLNVSDTKELVQTGIYAYVRHPMYTGIIGLSIALVLLFPSILNLLFSVVVIIALLKCRIPEEEANLTVKFGDKYKVYMAKTGSVLPFF